MRVRLTQDSRSLLRLSVLRWLACFCALLILAASAPAQTPRKPASPPTRPKLVVLLVMDQFRADYVDKFRRHWTAGLKRLLDQGAWFRQAAYPYAATVTCAGHATISTGAFPATHGIIGNSWWDRETGQPVTCTRDPNAQGAGYGAAPKDGESAYRLLVPSFADELRFQSGGAPRVVTFSLKARSAIMLAGRRADAVTWHDTQTGAWITSSAYGTRAEIAKFVEAHPAAQDFGKIWAPRLPASAYLYEESEEGKVGPEGWEPHFPHVLGGKPGGTKPDASFYAQWELSPFADAYLGRMAAAAVDSMNLGRRGTTDFLGVSFSTLDLVGHAYGPRSREVQDVLLRLDETLGELFAHLDNAIGRGNYVVALGADHGVAPLPVEMRKNGNDTGWLNVFDVAARAEKALDGIEPAGPKVLRVTDGDVYFAPGVYERLQHDPARLRDVINAIAAAPGVARVFRAEELIGRQASGDPLVRAAAFSYFPGRSGDLFIVPKPYWAFDFTPKGQPPQIGTTHGTPYAYDQRVPIFLMGWRIKPGEYFAAATPADIAPTLAQLCGITLAPRDGRVLAEALAPSPGARRAAPQPGKSSSAP